MREKQHQRGLSASYLEPDRYDEEEEGEESISLAAIKNRYKGGIRGEFEQKWNFVISGSWNHLRVRYTVNAKSSGILFLWSLC